jgi:hypothetical protein
MLQPKDGGAEEKSTMRYKMHEIEGEMTRQRFLAKCLGCEDAVVLLMAVGKQEHKCERKETKTSSLLTKQVAEVNEDSLYVKVPILEIVEVVAHEIMLAKMDLILTNHLGTTMILTTNLRRRLLTRLPH